MNENSFETMRDIGAEYGLSSHQLGKILTQQGFRTGGKPTSKAFDGGWVDQRHEPYGTHYIYAWHVGKTHVLLESLGFERKPVESTSQIE